MGEYWDWAKTRESDRFLEIERFYNEEFPVEVRSLLANFLAQDTSFLGWSPHNPSPLELRAIYEFIDRLKTALCQLFDNLPKQTNAEFFYKNALRGPCERIRTHGNDLQLFAVIWKSLTDEQQLLRHGRENYEEAALADIGGRLEHNLGDPTKAEITKGLTNSEQKCGGVIVCLQELSIGYNALPFLIASSEQVQREITRLQEDLTTFGNLLFECIKSLQSVRTNILKHLNTFKDKQRFVPLAIRLPETKVMVGNDGDDLDDFALWFGRMAHCFTQLEEKLPEYDRLCLNLLHERLQYSSAWAQDQIGRLREDFLRECLVIQKQPAQIIRNENNFGEVVLRLLPCTTGPWNIQSVTPVFISRDAALQVAALRQGPDFHKQAFVPPPAPGELKFVCDFQDRGNFQPQRKLAKMAKSAQNPKDIIRFPTMRVLKVEKEKKDRKKGESVVEKKYWMYFQVEVNWCGRTDYLHILSQPLCTTKHTSQEATAWASLTWFNAFSLDSRISNGIDVPDEVQWDCLIEIIDQEFVHLGRELSLKQKTYLKSKLLKDKMTLANVTITKNQFCKEKFAVLRKHDNKASSPTPMSSASSSPYPSTPDSASTDSWKRRRVAGTSRGSAGSNKTSGKEKSVKTQNKETNLSFGEWLYLCIHILNPTTKNGIKALSRFWAEGKIVGFMGKEDIQMVLKREQQGTVLIRFPENRPCHIGLYLYSEQATDSNEHLMKLLYTLQDLQMIPLEERILVNQLATTVYVEYSGEPGTNTMDKSVAFATGEKDKNDRVDGQGYWKPRTKVMEYFSEVILQRMSSARHMIQRMSLNQAGSSRT